jgi:hypothetical protein
MRRPNPERRSMPEIPAFVRSLLWEHNGRRLRWDEDKGLIIGRILVRGDWKAITWLCAQVRSDGIRRWLRTSKGRGLDQRRLRFWETVLNLPHCQVNGWIRTMEEGPWHRRVRP